MPSYPEQVRRQERVDARKRRRRFATPAIVTFRMAELFDYFNWLYGKAPLPDDDAGRDDIKLMFQVLSTTSDPAYRMFDVAGTWAPWFPPDELMALVDDVVAHPRRFKADTIAARLGITAEIRARLNLRTIGAIDKPAEQRAARATEAGERAETPCRRGADDRRGPRPQGEARTLENRKNQPLDVVPARPARRVRRPTATVYSVYYYVVAAPCLTGRSPAFPACQKNQVRVFSRSSARAFHHRGWRR